MREYVKQNSRYLLVIRKNTNSILVRDLQNLRKYTIENGTYEIIEESLVPKKFL